MIAASDIARWRTRVPWVDADQVEQDLVLSRVIVEIANDSVLARELVFRGGTCFHKLWLERPWRYSEDLDYVRTTAGGVGDALTALRSIAERIGFDRVTTEIGRHPKARFRSTFAGGGAMSIKIEINTFERSPARPIVTRNRTVDSPWFAGEAAVRSFDLPELIATKICAPFQRSKGRDLFDLWLAVHHAGASPDDIASCFEPYRPDGWSADRVRENLNAKLVDSRFIRDLDTLIDEWPKDYTIDDAAQIAQNIISKFS